MLLESIFGDALAKSLEFKLVLKIYDLRCRKSLLRILSKTLVD
jgi:hypothetical protein